MQLFDGLKVPALLLPQLTKPVGVIGVPGEVSVTVAVHVVGTFNRTVPGMQLTLVEVVRFVTTRLNDPELPEWVASPPYVPLIAWVPSEPGFGV